MTPTQILHAIYLSLIAGILVLGAAAMIWWHHDAVLQGAAECQKRVSQALADQQVKDAKASQDVIDELNQDKASLQAQLALKPPPVIRSCRDRVLYVDRPVSAPGPTEGTQPPKPTNGPVDSGVSGGGGGGDVGPGVRAIAAAGELLAVYRARLEEWELKTR